MNNLQRIHQIMEEHQYQDFDYPEGELTVDATTAIVLVKVYRALGEDNKTKFARMLETRHGILRLVDFCWSKVS